MIICPSCTQENIGDAQNCSNCGYHFQSDNSSPDILIVPPSIYPDNSVIDSLDISKAVVLIPPGEYNLHLPLIIEHPIIMKRVTEGRISISNPSEEPAIVFRGDGPWIIEGIDFYNKGDKPDPVVVVESGIIQFHRCRFYSNTSMIADPNNYYNGCGLSLKGESESVIINCVSKGNKNRGIVIQDSAHSFLLNNECSNNGLSGIAFWGSSSGIAERNQCLGNGGGGITGNGNTTLDLNNNFCIQNKVGIAILGKAKAILSGNVCENNLLYGIQVSEDASPLIIENICKSNKKSGIAYFGRSSGQAIRNTCIENQASGILVTSGTHPDITDNRIEKNILHGIQYDDQGDGNITNNQIFENRLYGVMIGKKCMPRLFKNHFKGNKKGSVCKNRNFIAQNFAFKIKSSKRKDA